MHSGRDSQESLLSRMSWNRKGIVQDELGCGLVTDVHCQIVHYKHGICMLLWSIPVNDLHTCGINLSCDHSRHIKI